MTFTTETNVTTSIYTGFNDHDHRDFIVPQNSLYSSSFESPESSDELSTQEKATSNLLRRILKSTSCRASDSLSSAHSLDSIPNLWRYPSEHSRSMERLPSTPTTNPIFVHKENICTDELQASPPARTDLPTAFEWLLKATGEEQGPALGYRHLVDKAGTPGPLLWQSRSDFVSDYQCLANGLYQQLDRYSPLKTFDDVGFRKQDGSFEQKCDIRFLGVMMSNGPAYAHLEFACQLLGVALVPLYTTLGLEAICYILEETKLDTVVVDHATLKVLVETLNTPNGEASLCYRPRQVLVCETPNAGGQRSRIKYDVDEMALRCQAAGIDVHWMSQLMGDEPLPKEHRYQWKKSDIWTLTYTSGTTGKPKGVMLTQSNLMDVTHDVISVLCTDTGLDGTSPNRCYFSYLPLAHIFERIVLNTTILQGCKVAFHTGNVLTLFDEIKAAKTTLFCAVPRVLERLRQKVFETIEAKGGVTSKLFHWAVNQKVMVHSQNGSLKKTLPDIILNKIKDKVLGTQVRFIVSGGAPLSTEVRQEIQAIFSCHVVVGYGMSESTGPVLVQHSSDIPNSIGSVLKSSRTMLRDVPELDYHAKEGVGELLLQGRGIFAGYFRQQQSTEETFVDGWFSTGDVAKIDRHAGCAYIIDRTKNCFKLAQGEYIAPEKIENALKTASSVEQIFIVGKSTETTCVAVIALSEGLVQRYSPRTLENLVKDPAVRDLIVKEVTAKGREANLCGFEIPKKFIFISRSVMPSDDLLTPTFKLKRSVFSHLFRLIIDKAYEQSTPVAVNMEHLFGDVDTPLYI